MKTLKHMMAVLLSAVMVTGIWFPVQTEAATRITSVKFVSLEKQWYYTYKSNYAMVSVKTKGFGATTQYQYRTYVNGKVKKSGYSGVYKKKSNAEGLCKVKIPQNTFVTTRIRAKRGGTWSAWSKPIAIGPGLKEFYMTGATKTTVTFKWKRMTGATDYAVYRRNDSGNKKYVRIKTVSASATSVKIDMSRWPRNSSYTLEVRPRKKVNGKYVDGKGYDYLWVYRYSDGEFEFSH